MRLNLFIIIILSLSSCKNKSWNLNETVGWRKPGDFIVVYLKLNIPSADSSFLEIKRQLDIKVLEELRVRKLGDVTENDEEDETDLHFVIPARNKKSLPAISEIIDKSELKGKIAIMKREYISGEEWEDTVIYPGKEQ